MLILVPACYISRQCVPSRFMARGRKESASRIRRWMMAPFHQCGEGA
jgi:hypothetical protein